jgi:hypothetical protein
LSLPSPPPVLPVSPQLHELSPGRKLVRIYNPAHGPWHRQRFYGPLPEMRFDHQIHPPRESPDRSVWYAATSLTGAVSEAFGNSGFIDKRSGRHICVVNPRLSLSLLDLVGTSARAFGLDQRIGTERDYSLCQRWARTFYEQYPGIQGIRWRGRQAGSICVLLNDRVEMDLLALVVDYDISHPDVWHRIARAARRCKLRIVVP